MKNVKIGKIDAPTVVLGCMRIKCLSKSELSVLINRAVDCGANMFDHANIYGGGECESLFGNALDLNSSFRKKIIIQSKLGIEPGKRYNFSKEHIISETDKILKRLKTDYLDVLLLHRPDALCEPQEVAEAINQLIKSGKVREFGVSNHTPLQIELISRALKGYGIDTVANQIQLGLGYAAVVSNGINANTDGQLSNSSDGILDYLRLKDMVLQAWSPMQYGFFKGVIIDNPKFEKLNLVMQKLADKYGVTKNTIAVAWILRLPGKMQVICGTTNADRFEDCVKASEIQLSGDDWYELYLAAGYRLP